MHSLVRDHYNSEASSQQLRARSLSSPSFQWSILSHRESTKSLHFPVVFSSPSGDHWGRLISQIIEFAAEPCSGRRNPLMSIWASLGEWNWKRLWCWERLGAGGERDDRGWDGWMASLTRWMWVWVNSGRWWWTGRSGVLRFMGSQTVRHDWVTELNWTELETFLVATTTREYYWQVWAGSGILLRILQDTGLPPTTRNYLAPNA